MNTSEHEHGHKRSGSQESGQRVGRGFSCACAATSGQGNNENNKGSNTDWQQKYEKAISEDLPKFWKDFRKQASLRFEILADDMNRLGGKIDRKFRVSSKVESLKNEVYVKFESLDNKFGVVTKVENALEDFKRNYPELKRKFTAFSNTTQGKVVIYGAFIYLVFSGIYLKILYFLFLLSLFSPLLLPFLQKFLVEQQSKASGAFNQQQSFNQNSQQNAGAWFDQMFSKNARQQQQSNSGRQNSRKERGKRAQGQDDIVVDAEWISVDDNEDE
jgi:hypothetical protein